MSTFLMNARRPFSAAALKGASTIPFILLAVGAAAPAWAAPEIDFRSGTPAPAPEGSLAAWTGQITLGSLPKTLDRGSTAAVQLRLPLVGEVDAVVQRVVLGPTGGVSWSGRLADGSDAGFVLAQVGDAVAGAVWHPMHGAIEIRPTGEVDASGARVSRVLLLDGEAEISCGAGAGFGNLRVPLEEPAPTLQPASPAAEAVRRGVVQTPRGTPTPPGCGDDGSVIDLMVVWTPAARDGAGGTSAIEAVSMASVASVNTAFVNSGLGETEIRLVHMHETDFMETLDEPDGFVFRSRLSHPGDGMMDEVPVLRDQYKADLVALLVNDFGISGLGGTAFLGPGSPEVGYSVTLRAGALGALIFAHEVAHNFGCQHDVNAYDTLPDQFYAIAHKFTPPANQLRRTIMAYSPGARIPHFSNPDIAFLGVPTGLALGSASPRHNAQVIRETRRSIANFRQSDEAYFDCDGNGLNDRDDIAGNGGLDVNGNGQIDSCEVRLYVDADAPGGGDGLSWATAFRDLTEALGTPRYLCDAVTEIWLAEGTYASTGPNDNRWDRFFVGPHMRLLGGFAGDETSEDQRDPAAHPTILTGDRLGDDLPDWANRSDNSINVIRLTGIHPSSLVDGIVIRGGQADFAPGGRLIGGALSGSAINGLWSNASLANCIIEDNATQVGTIYLGGGETTIFNTLIRDNRAKDFVPFATTGGGLILDERARTTLLNSTIAGNEATGGSGGAVFITANSSLTIANSIVWGNSDDSPSILVGADPDLAVIFGNLASLLTIRSSTIEGGPAGVAVARGNSLDYGIGNLDADPQFVDAPAGNHTLSEASPALNAGDDSALPADFTADLAGNPRVSGPFVDMGAYEFQGSPCTADLTGDGLLSFSDIVLWLQAFNAQGPAADFNNDGVISFSDLQAFLVAFNAGCP